MIVILCLGNVISAVPSSDLESFIKSLFNSLKPHGRMFFQALNFDNLASKESFVIKSTIENNTHHLRFVEPYIDRLALFHYVETDLKTAGVKITKNIFNAHLKNDINKALLNAGFADISFFR